VDRAALLGAVGGDRQLLDELVDLFAANTPALLADIAAAIAGSDARALRHSAHALKGTLLTLAARGAAGTARSLELIGAAGDLSDPAVAGVARATHALLVGEVARVHDRLAMERAA
jgi:HPt (histidine-containing phosphotransfer) domain-containing protein